MRVHADGEADMPDERGIFPFVRIGLNRASTFTGFCQRHDTEMFAPLETKPFTATKEQLFLLAYRAVAKEAFAKRFGIRMLPIFRLADVGKEPFEQYLVQEQLYQHEQLQSLSLRDLEATMKDYAAIYRSGDFDRMSAYLVFADRKIGFATSGGVHPEFDFEGNSLQALGSTDRLDQLTYSAIPFDDGSVFAFVWDSKANKSCIRLMQSLDRFSNDDLADALIRMTFEHFENNLIADLALLKLSSLKERLQADRSASISWGDAFQDKDYSVSVLSPSITKVASGWRVSVSDGLFDWIDLSSEEFANGLYLALKVISEEEVTKSDVLNLAIPSAVNEVDEWEILVERYHPDSLETEKKEAIHAMDTIIAAALGLSSDELEEIWRDCAEDPFLKRVKPRYPGIVTRKQGFRTGLGAADRYQ